jgi:hypothetical protein
MELISRLVANNAAWIHQANAALGKVGEFTPILWQNFNDMPPIFPNADTLGGTEAEQLQAIQALANKRSGKLVAVKDAWARLDLAPLGFEPLFEANWLYRDAAPIEKSSEFQIERITTPEALRDFAIACNGEELADVYAPALLKSHILWFLARKEGKIVGGITAFAAEGLNGLNNLFADDKSIESALIRAGINAFPDLPASDYTGDAGVPVYHALGFKTVGKLRVWLRHPQ